jgi:hypothetical protein
LLLRTKLVDTLPPISIKHPSHPILFFSSSSSSSSSSPFASASTSTTQRSSSSSQQPRERTRHISFTSPCRSFIHFSSACFLFSSGCAVVGRASINSTKYASYKKEFVDNKNEEKKRKKKRRKKEESESMNIPEKHKMTFMLFSLFRS